MSGVWEVRLGECVEAMAALPADSVDAVVTDPPYHLGFMGKAWDTMSPLDSEREHERWAREAFRVLKPGGHLVAFGGSRTYHRLASGVEDAGFEIRDQLQWLYGSGFPKSLDVSKAIDKAAGAEREVLVERTLNNNRFATSGSGVEQEQFRKAEGNESITAPATADAQRWAGYGTALKPAHEPIVLARKPLGGTVAANVLAHGTGALNIDGVRVPGGKAVPASASPPQAGNVVGYGAVQAMADRGGMDPTVGRWPSNVVLDEDAARVLDEQAPAVVAAAPVRGTEASAAVEAGTITGARARVPGAFHGDQGGASRFFYVAKASRAEREAGLGGMPKSVVNVTEGQVRGPVNTSKASDDGIRVNEPRANVHPTVKPVDAMRWLVRLVCPAGGLVLDPFNGSGSTGIAAVLEGRRYLGLEREAEYVEIARARIAWWAAADVGLTTPVAMKSAALHERAAAGGQFGLWDDDDEDVVG